MQNMISKMACIKGALFSLLFIKSLVFAAIEDIDLKYTQPAAAFDELYNDGIRLYSEEKWEDSVRSFRMALADYRHENEVKSNCIIQCREKVDKSNILRNGMYDGGTLVLYYVIRVRRCADLCREKFMGRRTPIAKFLRDAFEKREPYNYLQYSYFKLNQLQKAANAAFTYLERNPFEKTMSQNFGLYTSEKYNASKERVISYERYHHEELFLQGDSEYEQGNYSDCIMTFEASLDEYYREYSKCQALCEFQHEKHQVSYSMALFQHYLAIVQCRLDCHDKLSFVNGIKRERFLEDHYHYLQFCYFETGKTKQAATNAKTFLKFHSDDPIMSANLEFYLNALRSKESSIEVRMRAGKYLRQREFDKKLLAVAKFYANPDLIFEDVANDMKALENDENLLNDDRLESDQMATRTSDSDPKEQAPRKDKKAKRKLQKVIKKVRSWQQDPLFKGIKLHKEGKQLNGSERFIIDSIVSQDDCKILSTLVQKLTIKKLGSSSLYEWQFCDKIEAQNNSFAAIDIWLKGFKKLAKYGDGYKHNHADPKHPFTTKESFEGVNIKDAVEAAVQGDITLEEAELYANVSEKMRRFVEEYFQLKQPLYIAYTHLVCRTAYEDAAEGDHISHPVHSDNCILGLDGPNTCPKVPPAYVWRDFSGVLYLNGDFDGGEFIFTDPDGTEQTSVKPKCGRMVGFSGGIKNIHGVRGIKSGRRCALPLWFTLQGDKIEDNRGKYLNVLQNLRKEMNDLGSESADSGMKIKRSVDGVEKLESESGSGIKSEL